MGSVAKVSKEVPKTKTSQVLSVMIGKQIFGIPIDQIEDVLEQQPITFVPLAPPAVRGVMNLRGRIITVVDLRSAIGSMQGAFYPKIHYTSVVIENEGALHRPDCAAEVDDGDDPAAQ